MIKEQRKYRRFPVKLEAELTLYDTDTGEHLTEPVSGLIYNISRGGAVLELTGVIRQGKHLFFAPLESESIRFNLTISYFQESRMEASVFLAKPIWFNRNMDSEERSFLIGVEFQERLKRDELNLFVA